MFMADGWRNYEILDCSDGEKLERWGDKILVRPDPQVVWRTQKNASEWNTADARYNRSKSGGGSWQSFKKLPQVWTIDYKNLRFGVKPMGFKHTGLFPEQAANWDWFSEIIKRSVKEQNREINVLNLFAYTGGATVAAAAAGAKVCHVDAAKGMVSWKTRLFRGWAKVRFDT